MDTYAKSVSALLQSALSAGYIPKAVQTPHYLATIAPQESTSFILAHIVGSRSAVVDFQALDGRVVSIACNRAVMASQADTQQIEFIDYCQGL